MLSHNINNSGSRFMKTLLPSTNQSIPMDDWPEDEYYWILETPDGPKRISEEEYHQTRYYKESLLSEEGVTRVLDDEFVPAPIYQVDYQRPLRRRPTSGSPYYRSQESAMNRLWLQMFTDMNVRGAKFHASMVQLVRGKDSRPSSIVCRDDLAGTEIDEKENEWPLVARYCEDANATAVLPPTAIARNIE
jgi:hypothetical protein